MSHEAAGKSNEWYTPKYIFDALGCEFDLDVAHPFGIKTNVPTKRWIHSDSLDCPWNGFVWMNPPFGNMKSKYQWINKFIDHGNGIALMPDRTSAPWWQHFANSSDCVLFVSGKIKFIDQNGKRGESPSNGTTLFGIGARADQALRNAADKGLGKFYSNYDKTKVI